ncbi:tetratricopeptide repeat protein [Microbacterium sp. YY-01]|uniref:tetratricopeptide repeat protein n=1 Tax=Microbacterium sp. YY-01 TaxID=3421634 RepID=UPI003D1716D9
MSDISAAAMRGAVDLSALRNRPAAEAQGGQQHPDAAGNTPASAPGVIFDATDAGFQDVIELSRQVPVVVDLWAEWCGPCKQLGPILEKVVREQNGRVALAKVDVDANPQLAQAFQAQSIPMVVALIAGQPVPMFNGAVPEEQVRQVVAQLLQVAAQNGVSGQLSVQEEDTVSEADEAEPEEKPLPPLHQEAYDAISVGDYARAIHAYEKALAENPRDDDAAAGLGQVRLLHRTQGADLQQVRDAAAQNPDDVAAQLAVADLDVAGGHVDDAFARLLDLFARADSEERTQVRERLVEYFGLVGDSDPRVGAARARLASLLF